MLVSKLMRVLTYEFSEWSCAYVTGRLTSLDFCPWQETSFNVEAHEPFRPDVDLMVKFKEEYPGANDLHIRSALEAYVCLCHSLTFMVEINT